MLDARIAVPARKHLLALLLSAGAVGATALLRAYLHRTLYFVPLGSIVVCAVLGGYGPGALSTLIASTGLGIFAMEPLPGRIPHPDEPLLRFLLFLPVGSIVSFVGGRLKSALDEANESIMELAAERVARERIVAGITHDLRNPLAAIRACADLCRRNLSGQEPLGALLDKILQYSDRCDRMIHDILDSSQAQSGRQISLRFESFDLIRLLKEVVEEHQLSCGPGRVRLDSHPQAVVGGWDKGAMRRIMDNLVTNALKHGSDDKAVSIDVERDDSKIAISVRNQGDNARPRDSQRGWGLGLVVVKSLAEAHGGSLSHQIGPDDSRTFTVELPIPKDR